MFFFHVNRIGEGLPVIHPESEVGESRFSALTPLLDSYPLGMQKQRLLPSGSVTANSRSPHVWSTGAV
jgi:hypothetical protein